MKRVAFGLLLAACLGFSARRSGACSCSGQGPASALTRVDQTWGVRLSERLVLGQGAFNAHGSYQAFAPSEHDRTLEYLLLAAYRVQRLELAASFGYGARVAEISGESARTLGFGDTSLRARYETVSEPEPWQKGIYPALAMLATVRLPTAHATGIAPRGLGTAEFALGVAIERSLARVFRVGLLAEVAGRLPDATLGITRRLGPRASTELTLSWFATPDLVLSALLGLRWEGNVTVRQRQQSGTAQRTAEVGAAASWQPWESPIRTGMVARYSPGIDVLGANTLQGVSGEVWVGFVK